LGLANLPGIPPDEAVAALKQYRDALAEGRVYLQRRLDEQQPLPYFVEAMFDYSLTMSKAEQGWIEGAIQRIEGGGYF
jgi:hypothetical protein